MQADLKSLYAMMLRSRLFEERVRILWERGLIWGEMHMSMGEEGVAAGVIDHLREGDAMALDHRGTAPLLMRGEDAVLLLKEFLGRPDGLCGGRGGHMHLFSRRFMAASSGIVGASGPAAVGFGLACRRKNPQAVAVAFFGEGAMNQGMLLESMNLASAWRLPVIFVCKDNGLSISTPSDEVTGGDLLMRAQGLGLRPLRVDGMRVEQVWDTAREAVQEVREGGPPTFILATCLHLEGHFLGDGYLRLLRHPLKQALGMAGEAVQAMASSPGKSRSRRFSHLTRVLSQVNRARIEQKKHELDPIRLAREQLLEDSAWLAETEAAAQSEIESIVTDALAESAGTGGG